MEIIPHFWVTYYNENYHIIKEKKIKNIIHLSKNGTFIKNPNLDEIRIPIDYDDIESNEQQNINVYQHLYDVTDYIHEKIMNNEKIMLIGNFNKQDIDVFIIAYLIRYGKLNIQTSILFLKTKKRDIFHPKCLFFFALNKFYNELNKNY